MSAVLVYGERVELPEGWIVVRSGYVEAGDRYLATRTGDWHDIDDEDVGDYADDEDCVIRRDPKETP